MQHNENHFMLFSDVYFSEFNYFKRVAYNSHCIKKLGKQQSLIIPVTVLTFPLNPPPPHYMHISTCGNQELIMSCTIVFKLIPAYGVVIFCLGLPPFFLYAEESAELHW